MDVDLDLLLTVVYCIADDFLPRRPENARRSVTDAEIVALCVAQAIMGVTSDYRFVAVAGRPCDTCSRPCLRGMRFTSAGSGSLTRSRRWSRTSRARARGSRTTCCWSTPPRWSAPARARRSSAAAPPVSLTRSPTRPTTGIAPATAATSSGFACTPCSRPMAPARARADLPEDRREARLSEDGRLLRTAARPGARADRR